MFGLILLAGLVLAEPQPVSHDLYANEQCSGIAPDMTVRHVYPNAELACGPLFEFNPGAGNGIAQLSPILDINGTPKLPTFRYKLGDANATDLIPWGYGDTLSATGSGGIFNAGSPLQGALDDSYNSGGTRYYTSAASQTHNLGIEDAVITVLARYSDISGRIVGSRSAGSKGWEVYSSTSGRVQIWISDGVNTVTISTATLGLVQGSRFFLEVFLDRSGSAQAYVNGIASGGAVVISGVGDIDDSAAFAIGAFSAGSSNFYRGAIELVTVRKGLNWLDTHLQATIAKERFEKLQGTYLRKSAGSPSPVVASRAGPAVVEKIEADGSTKLYTVGDNWARVPSRYDANGVKKIGLLNEFGTTNLTIQSEDLSTSWTLDNGTDTISANTIAAPDGETTADGIIADATNVTHGVCQSVTLTAAQYSWSTYAYKGDNNFVILTDTTVTNTSTWFDIPNVAVGTQGSAALDADIEDLKNGWVRAFIRFSGTAAVHTLCIRSASTDGGTTFTGDGATVNLYAWGMQAEIADSFRPVMSSYIATTTATVARAGDILYYSGIGNVADQRGRIVVNAILQFTKPVSGSSSVTLSDGGSNNDRIMLYGDASKKFRLYSVSTEDGANVALTGTTNIYDQLSHEWSMSWKTNDYKFWVDGVLQGTDTTAPFPPNDIDRINIGSNNVAQSNFTGLIERVRIYK